MKNRGITNKISAIFLSFIMMTTILPNFITPVFSKETKGNELPIEQFATVEQLMLFNTNDNDGEEKASKVYFGNNNQQWWIAGSQSDTGMTLFAASPLEQGVQFNINSNEREYNGYTVYSKHYGASDIRNKLKELEASYFTTSEQALMNETTIYTNDTKNKNTYLTNDKLYLAYRDFNDDRYITVGTNSSDNNVKSLNDGLRVENDYWGDSNFWLRAPSVNFGECDLVASKSSSFVFSQPVYGAYAVVPAFELDLSSVLFASTVPAVSNKGSLKLNDAFTLRYQTDTLGIAVVSDDNTKITLTNVPENTYLVVQNKDGAKAKHITNETEVSAKNMGVESFGNCKVWLEVTDSNSRITYATMAIVL